jgi:hypothetical protein
VTGYNADLVVEASSTQPNFLTGCTTAAVEDGAANAGNTWYEQGYYPPAPETGLPGAGTTIIAAAASDHRYRLAPSYLENNAVLLDADNPRARISFAVPAPYSGLSFLTSSGHGPVTTECIVHHLDGTSETNSIIARDWLDESPMVVAGARVKLSKRLVDSLHSPKLYAEDFHLVNTSSPITNLSLAFQSGGLNSHAIIVAVSGEDVSTPPAVGSSLWIAVGGDGALLLNSSVSGKLQSTTRLEGDQTIWRDEGSISGTITLSYPKNEPVRFYRVLSQ